jgi:hypothetical protein
MYDCSKVFGVLQEKVHPGWSLEYFRTVYHTTHFESDTQQMKQYSHCLFIVEGEECLRDQELAMLPYVFSPEDIITIELCFGLMFMPFPTSNAYKCKSKTVSHEARSYSSKTAKIRATTPASEALSFPFDDDAALGFFVG